MQANDNLATDSTKRDLFAMLALHFKAFSDQLERATKAPPDPIPAPQNPPTPKALG